MTTVAYAVCETHGEVHPKPCLSCGEEHCGECFCPTPPQREVYQAIADVPPGGLALVGYGGAVGGGKTRLLAELALDLAIEFPGVRLLIGRRDFTDLRTTTMDEFYAIVPRQLIVKQRDTAPYFAALRLPHWPKGVESRVYFRELKDWTGLGSEQYGFVLLEEAGEIPERSALMLLGRLRHPAAPKTAFIAASNPWPGWFESWFFIRDLPEDLLRELNATVTFIPAKIRDNPYVKPSPEAYEARLRALYPPDWVDRLVEGRFDAFVGQVHAELSRSRHLWISGLPKFSRLVGGLDFGGQNPHDHMTAGVVGGIIAAGESRANHLVRFGHFEDRGPGVYDALVTWMRNVEAAMGRKVEWVADKTQMWGIDLMQGMGFLISPSHGGQDSVDAGIGLQNRRFRDGASWFTEDLLAPPGREAEMRGAKAWFERMRAYKWDEEPNDPSKPVKRVPIKRDDDTCFPAGTLVTMADGSCRPIETIRAGDRVLGARGGVTVIASGMTSDDAPLVRVAGIVCTPNHLILTDRGWVRADEIVTGDSVYTDADRYNVMHDSAEDDLERLDVPSLPRLEASVTSCLLAASPHRGGAVSASRRVGDGEWSIAGWMGSSPPRRKPAEQRAVEPRSFVVSGRACQAPSRVGDQRPETDRQGDRGVACLARHARRIGLAPRARQTHVDRSRGRTDDVPTLRPVVYDEAGVGEAVEVLLRPVQSGCPAGSAPVYDLTLDDADHLFFANGVAVHNCNADRYMHEAADGFPMVRATKVTRDMLGLPLATEAV